jgi:predicted nucleic acid-binding protein
MSKRTYVDANVLIAAFQTENETAARALAILDDPDRWFVTSAVVSLETLPKPRFHGLQREVQFIEGFLKSCPERVEITEALVMQAVELAARYDLSPIDALHASAAITSGVDEFITLEKPSKPLHRITEVKVVSLYQNDGTRQ